MDMVSYLHLRAGEALPALSLPPFKAIVVAEEAANEERRDLVAAWLVHSGCLYLVAWGQDCKAWHDSADHAHCAEFNFENAPDDRFVMTTWHEGEPLSEAFWFAAVAAQHPTVDLTRTLIVHVASDEQGAQLMAQYRSASEA